MSEKFKPLKTMEATCKECGHVGMIECSDKQANTAVVNFVAQFRCQIEALKAERDALRARVERLEKVAEAAKKVYPKVDVETGRLTQMVGMDDLQSALAGLSPQ